MAKKPKKIIFKEKFDKFTILDIDQDKKQGWQIGGLVIKFKKNPKTSKSIRKMIFKELNILPKKFKKK